MEYIVDKEKESKVNALLNKYKLPKIADIDAYLKKMGLDVEREIHAVQPIAYDNAVQAYIVGLGVALAKKAKKASDVALRFIGTALIADALILITVGRIMIASTSTAARRFAPPVN